MSYGDYNSFYARDFNYYGLLYTLVSVSESASGKPQSAGNTYSIDASGNSIPISQFHIAPGWSVNNSGTSILKVNGEDYVLYSGPAGNMDPGEQRFGGEYWDPGYNDYTYGGEILPKAHFDWGSYPHGWQHEVIERFILDTNMWYGRTSQVYTDDGYVTVYHTNERDQEEYPVLDDSGSEHNNLDRGVKYWYLDEDRQICMYTYQRKWVPTGLTLSCWPEGDPDRDPPVPDGHDAGPHPRSAAGSGAQTDYDEPAGGVYALWASGNVLGWGIVYAGDGWSEEKRGNHIHTESVAVTQSTDFPRHHTGVEMPEGGGSSWISFSKGLCKRIQMIKIREGEEYELAV